MSIFVWLSLVALIFGLLGFLIHAFYFGRQEPVVDDSLHNLVQSLNRKLAAREKMNAEAQEEIAKTREMVESLKKQLEQRDEQMSALQAMARRQQEELSLLQGTAAQVKTTGAGPEAPAPPAAQPAAPATEASEQKVPLWKDNLNNILSMLDKLQREANDR